MATQLILREVLEMAIEREIASQRLYTDLSNKMTNQVAKDAFQQLSRQEQEHEDILKQYRQGKIKTGMLDQEQVIDYKIAEYFDQPEMSPNMELKDVFLLAANRELHAHLFYLILGGIHPPGEVRKLLDDLAAQELEHKQILELLYTEVAFPQTDGG